VKSLQPEDAASPDSVTASAFSESWNRLRRSSVYSREQFLDWFSPIDPAELKGKTVAELGFGNGSLLYHMAAFEPSRLCGVELGDTLETARRNLSHLPPGVLELRRGDLTQIDMGTFDLVYCIGVLHHLKDPAAGFRAVLRHTRPGGRFHCWVYAYEGNAIVRYLVDPLRKIASRLPWWFTKYALALPLVVPYFFYAKLLKLFFPKGTSEKLAAKIPLFHYSQWIAKRGFDFFHHIAFDQLVSPQTSYIPRSTIDEWLHHPRIDPRATYVIFRNANSWKFGGRTRP
jgi:SAM-dependent methyltransferase